MTLFDEPSRKPLPQPEFEDVAHAGRKALISVVPFVGSAASELLGLLSSPIAQRRDNWLTDLERRLRELEDRTAEFKFEDLGQNEQFVSATVIATQAATRTTQQEKLRALQNAVLNAAVGTIPDEVRQAAFLALIDRFQPAHLRILQTFQTWPNSGQYQNWQGTITLQNPGTPTRWIRDVVSGFRQENPNFIRMLLTDLYNAGLSFIKPDSEHIPNDGRWITDPGFEFLRFVSDPSR